MSGDVLGAARLMTADQYRHEAQKLLIQADNAAYSMTPYLVGCAQVYALLAISAQAAENAADTPF